MKIKILNNFHKTSVCLMVRADGHISVRQAKRARRVLCGQEDCSCADGPLGMSGPQDGSWAIVPTDQRVKGMCLYILEQKEKNRV